MGVITFTKAERIQARMACREEIAALKAQAARTRKDIKRSTANGGFDFERQADLRIIEDELRHQRELLAAMLAKEQAIKAERRV